MQFETVPNNETWLICGGREFHDWRFLEWKLNRLVLVRGEPIIVVTGGAYGADGLGGIWAENQACGSYTEYAKWELYGKSAGMIRNSLMLAKYNPDLVIAFPGGKGTAGMIDMAKGAGVEVIQPKVSSNPH